jgi:hypothetical protein
MKYGRTNTYVVGTFWPPGHAPGKRATAYLRDYVSSWPGCIEYVVQARSGAEAKKLAMRRRAEHECAREIAAKL